MATITIPDETYQRLQSRAADLNTTIEDLATPALEQAAKEADSPQLTDDEWRRKLEDLNTLIQSRADRYPPGYQADASRESIYDGCGE